MLSNLFQTITQNFGATSTCEVDATTTADTGPALVTEIHGQDSQGETQEQAVAADPSSGLSECGVQCSFQQLWALKLIYALKLIPPFSKLLPIMHQYRLMKSFPLISGTFLMIIRILLNYI